jgi:hypothetical protein
MKIEREWDERLGSLPFAADVLNRFYWNVTVEHRGGEVQLRTGEALIASFPSIQELGAFAAGMALALSMLPEPVIRALDQEVGEE